MCHQEWGGMSHVTNVMEKFKHRKIIASLTLENWARWQISSMNHTHGLPPGASNPTVPSLLLSSSCTAQGVEVSHFNLYKIQSQPYIEIQETQLSNRLEDKDPKYSTGKSNHYLCLFSDQLCGLTCSHFSLCLLEIHKVE